MDEVDAYLARATVKFPPPLLTWMARPQPDQGLGRRCLLWIYEQYPTIKQVELNIVHFVVTNSFWINLNTACMANVGGSFIVNIGYNNISSCANFYAMT